MATEIHEYVQNLLDEQRKRKEFEEIGQAIEEMRFPVSARIEDRYIFILDKFAAEYQTSRSAILKDLIQAAVSDMIDELGYDFDELTEEYIEHKKKEMKKNV